MKDHLGLEGHVLCIQNIMIQSLLYLLFIQEKEGWIKLCERVSEKCYVVGDAIYHRPGQLKDEELVPELKTSAICLKLEQMNTVSDILTVCKKMEGS